MKAMPTVWICNRNPGHSYEDARRYGTLRSVTEGRVSVFATDRLLADLDVALRAFGTTDYLLLSGNVVICTLAGILLGRRFPKIQLLVFDQRVREYLPRTVDLPALFGAE